jgi:hypothetical protein
MITCRHASPWEWGRLKRGRGTSISIFLVVPEESSISLQKGPKAKGYLSLSLSQTQSPNRLTWRLECISVQKVTGRTRRFVPRLVNNQVVANSSQSGTYFVHVFSEQWFPPNSVTLHVTHLFLVSSCIVILMRVYQLDASCRWGHPDVPYAIITSTIIRVILTLYRSRS